MRTELLTRLLLVAWVVLLTASFGYGQACPPWQAGCLDTTFGSGGIVETHPPLPNFTPTSDIKGTVVQADGKAVVLMYARTADDTVRSAMVRLNTDGTIDTTFGPNGNGWLYLRWSTVLSCNAQFLLVQNFNGDERFVVGGLDARVQGRTTTWLARLERYSNDGLVDSEFGIGGATVLNIGYTPYIGAIDPSNQKIVIGYNSNPLARLNADGSPDTSFGPNGISTTQSGISIGAVMVLPSGKILAAGSYNAKNKYYVAVTQFNSNGSTDTGFGSAGKSLMALGQTGGSASDITTDAAGNIIVAGSGQMARGLAWDAMLFRLTPAGQFDLTFGIGGKTNLDVGGNADSFSSLAIQGDGRIVAVGNGRPSDASTDIDILVARYWPDGTLDSTFGSGGWFTKDFYWSADTGNTVDLVNGKILLVAGVSLTSTWSPRDMVAMRLLP